MKNPTRPAGGTRRALSSTAGPIRWIAIATHPALVSAFVALALYLPSVGYGFVRDDHELIVRNPFLHRDGFLARLLTSDFWSASGQGAHLWRPLVTLSYWLEGRALGWSASGFHAVNVVTHGAASAALAWLVMGCGVPRTAALAAGVWFATMPAHVESVSWIAGRTDVVCALFAFLALALDARARRAGGRGPGVAAPTALLAALLAKEAALPLVAILGAAWWIEPGRELGVRAAARWVAPYVVVTAVYVLAHEVFAAPLGRPAWVDAEMVAKIRWAGWTMLPEYLAMLWPGFVHAPDLALPLPRGPGDARVLAGMAVTLFAIAGAVILVVRRSRWAVPALLALLPLLVPVALAWSRGHMSFAERLLYVPSGGFAWMLALGIASLARAPSGFRRAGLIAVWLLIAAGTWRAAGLIPDWRNDLTMYAALTRAQPGNVRGRIGYANQLSVEGRDDEALAELAQAESLDARMPELHATRAVIHIRHGQWPQVLESAERALALDPGLPQAQLLRATALLRLRRLEDAGVALEGMLAGRPGDPAVEGVWGQLLLVRGEPAAAIPFLDRAARWNVDDASVAYALGVACQLERRWPEARAAFERTVAIDPLYYEAWLRLAVAAHETGDVTAREGALATARQLPETKDGRADALARLWSGR